ncbi:Hypothetical predicted protein [Lecanosticta acicola]|uniref:Carboxymuconolactone decarboxylase-like domain-containing protein n=1 Tax=Lecanosticta acicola TaxID=111012 RepID=A0AAI8YS77_9PEZI|nr:Hypothetical predicted protein [Lecanosticta acicola]
MGSRIPPRPREELSPKEQEEYDHFSKQSEFGFGKNGEKFLYKDASNGAFIGPYPFLQAAPDTGKMALELVFSVSRIAPLPADVKETAILTAGGHFQAAYELYAHANVAVKSGVLSRAQVDVLKSDRKPGDLNGNCSLAYDVAKYLCGQKGPLPKEDWERSVRAFGKEGTLALVHYIGYYAYLCIALNAVDASVPE